MIENHVENESRNRERVSSTASAHTPGPWHVGVSCDGTPAVCVPVPPSYGSGFVVAHINRITFKTGVQGDAEANARLIAAAPDMLEALRAALPALESIHDPGNPILEAAYAAIAKAEGDKP
jgi:hypothetical protein